MNKKGLSFFYYLFLLVILSVGWAVSVNPNFDINSFKDNLNWTHVNITLQESPDLGNALESFINGVGEAMYSFIKWVAQISYEHPEINFKLLFILLLITILLPLIINLIKLSVIIYILIHEYYLTRKEKKKLIKLEREVNLKNIKSEISQAKDEINEFDSFWDKHDTTNKKANN